MCIDTMMFELLSAVTICCHQNLFQSRYNIKIKAARDIDSRAHSTLLLRQLAALYLALHPFSGMAR